MTITYLSKGVLCLENLRCALFRDLQRVWLVWCAQTSPVEGFPSTCARGKGIGPLVFTRPLSCIDFLRNEALMKGGLKFPNPIKTGTTIAGIVFKVTSAYW